MATAVILRNPAEISAQVLILHGTLRFNEKRYLGINQCFVCQAAATFINGFASSLTLHPVLFHHLLAATRTEGYAAGAAEVATSLHGLAVLGWDSAEWLAALSAAASATESSSWLPEEAAMLAWAVAVMQVTCAMILSIGRDAAAASSSRSVVCVAVQRARNCVY